MAKNGCRGQKLYSGGRAPTWPEIWVHKRHKKIVGKRKDIESDIYVIDCLNDDLESEFYNDFRKCSK